MVLRIKSSAKKLGGLFDDTAAKVPVTTGSKHPFSKHELTMLVRIAPISTLVILATAGIHFSASWAGVIE